MKSMTTAIVLATSAIAILAPGASAGISTATTLNGAGSWTAGLHAWANSWVIPSSAPNGNYDWTGNVNSGTTSGTESSCRNAEELSTTTQPAAAATGANSFEMEPPALNRAMSIPLNESFVSSCTVTSLPWKGRVLPADRAEASKVRRPTGNRRRSRTLSISTPTAPVAPTTAC